MDLIVRTDDSIRLQNWDARVFADVCSNNQQCAMDVCFYENHKNRLIKKNNTFKMFVIPQDYNINEYDFGWWSDGDIVWQSF